MSEDQIKKFLIEIQKNKNLRDQVLSVATANEIAKIANDSGFEFKGSELKNILINNLSISNKEDVCPGCGCSCPCECKDCAECATCGDH